MEKMEKYMILVTTLMAFLCVFVVIGIGIALPTIGKEFGMNNVVQNWSLTLFSVCLSVCAIPAGQITSKFGSRKIFIIGAFLFVFGLILTFIANSSELFLVSRVLQGVGYAIYSVAEVSILMYVVNEANRGKSLGIVMMGSYLGNLISPALGGYLIFNFGWKTIIVITIVAIILCMALFMLKIDGEWKSDDIEHIDLVGTVLAVLGLFAFTYGFTELLSFTGQIAIIAAIIILVVFGIYEWRIESPVFNIGLFKNRTFAAYNVAGFLVFFGYCVYDVLFNYYFQYVYGWDAQVTGMMLMIGPAILTVLTPLAGKLSDKVHPQKLSTVGIVIVTIAILFNFMILDVKTPIYMIVIAMVLLAIGTALFSVPNTNAIMGTISEKNIPYASATALTLRSTGQTLSLALLTFVFAMFMGSLALSPENAAMVVSSMKTICISSIILCVFAILFAVYGIRSEKPKEA